ncbi:uncharacterized protein LOC141628630 [Silene latifolia]|uniref:uncharacterized protein LOC141628630 n=1 Tax=Silene latifolia TaxID=37657 RepID=UPI003D77A7BB
MEYLTRILNFTTKVLPFKHHSLCRKLKLSHLMFVDDLLMFSRGDSQSVMLLLRSFASFSRASGLEMNNDKSSIYFNGVHGSLKQQLIARSGSVEGQIPFNYLGVPIAAGVLKQIDNICRNYLWDGTSDYMRVPLVGWDHVCIPQSEGGLGVRNSAHWNLATIGKLVWWIYSKPDSLWVKWNGYSHGTWLADLKGYSVKSGYDWIRLKETKVGWSKLVWNNAALPKHCFVNWLIMRNALNTKEKLYRIGVSSDDLCCICQAGSENVTLLFQHCPYVLELLEVDL